MFITHYPPIQVYLMLHTYLFCYIMNGTSRHTLFCKWKGKLGLKNLIDLIVQYFCRLRTYCWPFNMHTFFCIHISARNLSKGLKDNYIGKSGCNMAIFRCVVAITRKDSPVHHQQHNNNDMYRNSTLLGIFTCLPFSLNQILEIVENRKLLLCLCFSALTCRIEN